MGYKLGKKRDFLVNQGYTFIKTIQDDISVDEVRDNETLSKIKNGEILKDILINCIRTGSFGDLDTEMAEIIFYNLLEPLALEDIKIIKNDFCMQVLRDESKVLWKLWHTEFC